MKIFFAIIGVLLIIGGTVYFLPRGDKTVESNQGEQPLGSNLDSDTPTIPPAATGQEQAKPEGSESKSSQPTKNSGFAENPLSPTERVSENPTCSPSTARFSNEIIDLKKRLSEWNILYVNSRDGKNFCVYKKYIKEDKDLLLYDHVLDGKIYKEFIQFGVSPLGFQLFRDKLLFYSVLLPSENSIVLRKRDIFSGNDNVLYTYRYTEQQNKNIAFADLAIIDGRLLVVLSLIDKNKDGSRNFRELGVGFAEDKLLLVFELAEDTEKVSLLKELAFKSYVHEKILALRNNNIFIELGSFESPSDIEVYSFLDDSHRSLGKKIGPGYYGYYQGQISPDGKYFAFEPMVLDDVRTGNTNTIVAILDFDTGSYFSTPIVSSFCTGQFAKWASCFRFHWVNNSQFLAKERVDTYEPTNFYLVSADGTFKKISKEEFDSSKSIEVFQKEYEDYIQQSFNEISKYRVGFHIFFIDWYKDL